MWLTSLIAAALSAVKAGLPVKNGSISTALPAKSRRNAEWPNQVICMARVPLIGEGLVDREDKIQDKPHAVEINRAGLCVGASALLGQGHARTRRGAWRDCSVARAAWP